MQFSVIFGPGASLIEWRHSWRQFSSTIMDKPVVNPWHWVIFWNLLIQWSFEKKTQAFIITNCWDIFVLVMEPLSNWGIFFSKAFWATWNIVYTYFDNVELNDIILRSREDLDLEFWPWRQFLKLAPKAAPSKYDILIFFVFPVHFSSPTPISITLNQIKPFASCYNAFFEDFPTWRQFTLTIMDDHFVEPLRWVTFWNLLIQCSFEGKKNQRIITSNCWDILI